METCRVDQQQGVSANTIINVTSAARTDIPTYIPPFHKKASKFSMEWIEGRLRSDPALTWMPEFKRAFRRVWFLLKKQGADCDCNMGAAGSGLDRRCFCTKCRNEYLGERGNGPESLRQIKPNFGG